MDMITVTKAYTYSVDGHGDIVWDIGLALAFANAGEIETTIEVDRDQMAMIAARNDFNEARLAEVDPSIPGIAAPVWIPQIDQRVYVLIDGTHRCVRALRDGVPFHARVLTHVAALKCMVECADELWPWRDIAQKP